MAHRDDDLAISRRRLLAASVAGAAVLGWPATAGADDGAGPVFVATWPHGLPAVEAAARELGGGGTILDAVVAGVEVPELDPDVTSVGRGGWPNEAGVVQLDASVMDGTTRRVGAVGALEKVATAAAVARRVMEETRHAFLVGAGALEFARAQGFEETELLTERAKVAWERWKAEREAEEGGGDTIGLLGLDASGRMAGACTTSGLAWKMPGRVGDSPIVGAGLYVDDRAGGATATGVGEEVIRVCGSFLAVERMRSGDDPQSAVEAALARIVENAGRTVQVGMLALDRTGRIGAASLQSGFRYAVHRAGRAAMFDAKVL